MVRDDSHAGLRLLPGYLVRVGSAKSTSRIKVAPAAKVDRDGEPPFDAIGVGYPAAVLIVAAGELHVVEDDPDVGDEQLGQGGQPREEVWLVNGAQQVAHG